MKRTSLFAILISALLFAAHDIQVKSYSNSSSLIYGDVISYYQILPAIFAEHDISFSFLDHPSNYETAYWPIQLQNGKRVNKVSFGMAYLYLPFFLPTHYSMVALGIPAHGFSYQYKIALLLASIFYTILALLMIRKMLALRFSDSVIAITILLLALGTNLFYYASREAPLSHAFSFFLITAVIYYTNSFFNKPGPWYAFVIGVLIGITVLVRPTNILVALFPVLWGVSSIKQMQERFSFWVKKWKLILLALIGFILFWIPQVMYWKYITGEFFYNGYTSTGAKFFFNNPQIINSFFSYRKGWLLYTPVMGFAILGFFFLRKYYKESLLAISLFFVLSVYVISSWWLWWYGGGYGLRAYVDIYGALAFPLAAFISYVFEKRHRIVKAIVVFLSFIFIGHNLFQVEQMYFGAMHFSEMTKEAYWESFGHLHPNYRMGALLVPLDYKSAAKGIYPEPAVKKKTTEEWIAYYENGIKGDSVRMKEIEKNAENKGISTSEELYGVAKYCYEMDLEKVHKDRFNIFK
jgi:hypothetical protein